MNRDRHEPDEQFLTESARRQVEQDNRESAADDSPMGPIGEVPSRHEAGDRSAEAGLTEAAIPGQGPTADDATPETLMPDDGARSPQERGPVEPAADTELEEVPANRIGAGKGLDEAELARRKPLDGKPWDGNPDEPLEPATAVDNNLATPPLDESDKA